MVRKKISDFLLYRARYQVAFAGLILLLLVALTLVGNFIPGGLSKEEMSSASSSIHTPLLALNGDETKYLLDLPYHLFQKVSIMLLGVTSFAIKLPSLLLAFMSAVALYGVLRLWFRRNTAILTSLIAISSAQFLFTSQLGTPDITYIFWPAILLMATSMIAYASKTASIWVIIAAIAGALSLYTPLMIYIVAALAATCLIHPHARFVVFKQSSTILSLSAIIFFLLLSPIAIGMVHTPGILADLLGFNGSTLSLKDSVNHLAPYIQLSQPAISTIVTPVYSLVVLLLITIGAIRLVTTKYTAKSYILSIVFFFFVIGVLSGILPASFTFVPAMVLVAFAMNYIIRSWYELFPLNPYARVVGLLPLAVLLAGISLSEFDRYIYGMQYGTSARASFQKDVKLLDVTIKSSNDKFVLLTTNEQLRFYTDFAERTKTLNGEPLIVTANRNDASSKSATHTIITPAIFASTMSVPVKVIVSATSNDAARFYLYKNNYK